MFFLFRSSSIVSDKSTVSSFSDNYIQDDNYIDDTFERYKIYFLINYYN